MMSNKYIWGQKLGKGTSGTVYKVTDRYNPNIIYAGKVIPKNPLFVPLITREIGLLEKMSVCENSVRLYDKFEDAKNFVLIMELCDGDLRKVFDKLGRPFTPDEIFLIFHQLNKAFLKMQELKIIHRDLKLENILIKYVDRTKTKYMPKISDYGLGKDLKRDIAKTVQIGTPYTVAPELNNGTKPIYDSKCDVWSVGCMIYHMMTKDFPPFTNKVYLNDQMAMADKMSLKKSSDPYLNDLLNRIFVVDPNYRISWNDYFNHPFFKTREAAKAIQKIPKNFAGHNSISPNGSPTGSPNKNRHLILVPQHSSDKSGSPSKIIKLEKLENKIPYARRISDPNVKSCYQTAYHQHPLFHVKLQEFVCQVCNTAFGSNDAFKCVKCDFTMCKNCMFTGKSRSNGLHKRAGTPCAAVSDYNNSRKNLGPSPKHVEIKRDKTPERNRTPNVRVLKIINRAGTSIGFFKTDKHEHVLEERNTDTEFICNVCKNQRKKSSYYKCESCNFYLCLECYEKEKPDGFEVFLKISMHKHPLIESKINTNWKCDSCQKQFINGKSFRCNGCNFDICLDCSKKKI